MALVLLGFLVRLAVAAWNGFAGPSFGAEADAAEFHQRAIEWLHRPEDAEFALGWLYSMALALVYAIVGESLFIGSVLSCLAWWLSAWLLARLWMALGMGRRGMVMAFALYALLPTSVLHTSVTLREAFQLLFVNLAVLGAVRWQMRPRWQSGAQLLGGGAGMAMLHGALAGFAAMLAAMALLGRLRAVLAGKSRRQARLTRWWTVAAVVLTAVAAALLVLPSLQEELLETALATQQGYLLTDARAQYRTDVDLESGFGWFSFVPVALLQYQLEPVPWRGLSAVDLPLVAENLVRATLLVMMLLSWRRRPRAALPPGTLLVGMAWLTLEGLWAVGTVNWGTAARHHIPGWGLLLCAALASHSRTRRQPFPRQPPLPDAR